MAIVLLSLVTLFYAGYNLFVKAAGGHVPREATTTILATFCVQAGAVMSAATFLAFLALQGGHGFKLSQPVYLLAATAGLCIGAAEVGYFYLFGGVGGIRPLPASLAIPTIVSGTIVITLLVSIFLFGERLTLVQLLGAVLVVAGIVAMFAGRREGVHA